MPTLIESELFGYEKGAFTGAMRAKTGLFQAASGGTIFLDEIGELPLEMQAKLLRVLQEKEVRPVGSNQKVKVDVRVIAATNRDLETDYRKGTFRKDLYFRLNVVTVHLPTLRERRPDIPLLANWFLDRYAPGNSIQITQAATKCLLQYEWPGNVRELENCIERAVALGDRKVIDIRDLPPSLRGLSFLSRGKFIPVAAALSSTDLEDIERITIQRVFEQVNGDKARARKMLGISRATLYRKLKRYNIGRHRQWRQQAIAAMNRPATGNDSANAPGETASHFETIFIEGNPCVGQWHDRNLFTINDIWQRWIDRVALAGAVHRLAEMRSGLDSEPMLTGTFRGPRLRCSWKIEACSAQTRCGSREICSRKHDRQVGEVFSRGDSGGIPIQLTRVADESSAFSESTVIEFGTPNEVLFSSSCLWNLPTSCRLRNSDGTLDAEACVVAVQYTPG